MAEIILEVKDLKKYFQTPRGLLHAVDGVSFTIESGKTLGRARESGCGKSTTGRAIIRLLEPTGGEIYFEGKNIKKLKKKEMRQMRKDMQIIFQDPYSSLNPKMSVSELIREPIIVNKILKNKHEIEMRILELMEMCGLAERLYHAYPHELDGGRRQRIGVARALSLSPKFIVCDEPVSALDVSIQAQILNLLQDLQEQHGLTYIFVTHDLSVVKHISNDILVMYIGAMVEKSPAKELFKLPLHPYTKGLLSAIPVPNIDIPKKKVQLQGELTSPIEPKQQCRFVARCQYATEACHSKVPEYEEVLPGHFVSCHNVRSINGL